MGAGACLRHLFLQQYVRVCVCEYLTQIRDALKRYAEKGVR